MAVARKEFQKAFGIFPAPYSAIHPLILALFVFSDKECRF
jgi:hypothetical protein